MIYTYTNLSDEEIVFLVYPLTSLAVGESMSFDTMSDDPTVRMMCASLVQPFNSAQTCIYLAPGMLSVKQDDVELSNEEYITLTSDMYAEYHKSKGISYLAEDEDGKQNLWFDIGSNRLAVRDPLNGKVHYFVPDSTEEL